MRLIKKKRKALEVFLVMLFKKNECKRLHSFSLDLCKKKHT